jgi:hypothetical protein
MVELVRCRAAESAGFELEACLMRATSAFLPIKVVGLKRKVANWHYPGTSRRRAAPPPQIRWSAADYAAAEKSDASRRVYKLDFNHFRSWYRSLGCTALPASVGTVAAYLAGLADAG